MEASVVFRNKTVFTSHPIQISWLTLELDLEETIQILLSFLEDIYFRKYCDCAIFLCIWNYKPDEIFFFLKTEFLCVTVQS